MARKTFLSMLAVFLTFSATQYLLGPKAQAKDKKLKAEELVAKHLASIGSDEARAAVQTRLVNGTAFAIFRLGGTGRIGGGASILSEGHKTRLGMTFPSIDYPGEQWACTGKKVTVGYVKPGQRSNLSAFVYAHSVLLKEGLLGGVLSLAWPLLEVAERRAKLDSRGLKKVEGRQLYELRYKARKGMGDIRGTLHFEPETFRHLRSEYRVRIPAQMGITPDASARQRDVFMTLVEHFGQFKEVDGLTLPYMYEIKFTIEGQNSTFLAEWTIDVTQVVHNQEIDQKYFKVN